MRISLLSSHTLRRIRTCRAAIPCPNVPAELSGGSRAGIGSSCVFRLDRLNHAGALWIGGFNI
jgi:hypothetical protein